MKIFLDVGAHKGETLEIALEAKYGFDRLDCFEPVPECCNIIRATYQDQRVQVFEYGLWNQDCIMPLYSPGDKGASVFKDKPNHHANVSRNVKFVRSSSWFKQNLNANDQVYLKINCEGSECVILDDLIDSGEYKKIAVLMVDFDVRKIPSQKHLMNEMKARLNQLGIPKTFYIDEYDLGRGTHSYLTHYWLDNSMEIA